MGDNPTHESPTHLAAISEGKDRRRYRLSSRGRWLLVAALVSIAVWCVIGAWGWHLLSPTR